ncbi:HD domain-containing protein, partial [Patescibacteria group bacterium]|nr:HD domain-containing protein [Patescibacteria group bacterium]
VKRWNSWNLPFEQTDFDHVWNGLHFLELLRPYIHKELFPIIVEKWIHHDDVEIIAGDTILCSYLGNKNNETEKFQRELSAVNQILGYFPINCGSRLEEIFLSYETLKSDADIFIKIVDKMEAQITMLDFPNDAILNKGRDSIFEDIILDFLYILPDSGQKKILDIRDLLKRKCDLIFEKAL